MAEAQPRLIHDDADTPQHEHRAVLRQMRHPGFLAAGVGLAVGVALLHRLLTYDQVVVSLAILVGLLGGVYMGMGVVNPDPKQRWLQIGVGSVVGLLAFAGVWVSPLFFAVACFTHAAWDVVTRHPRCLNVPVAGWYVPLCLGYDVLFGVLIVVWWAL